MERCERCGEDFSCGSKEGKASCWCAELPAVLPVPAPGAKALCLCPKCLRAEAERLLGSCLGCQHSKAGTTKGGGAVFRCLRADTDPGYARYPRLPVKDCPGRA